MATYKFFKKPPKKYVVYLLEIKFVTRDTINTIYKIGYSSNVKARVNSLFRNSHKCVFSIKCIWYKLAYTEDNAKLVESDLHNKYWKYLYIKRCDLLHSGNSELFSLPEDKVKEIKQLNLFCTNDLLIQKCGNLVKPSRKVINLSKDNLKLAANKCDQYKSTLTNITFE